MTQAQTDALSAAALAANDPRDMLADALSLADQLRDATWKVESAGLSPWDATGGLVIAGMGGSGIGGALAVAAIGEEASRPITVVQGYELPSWITPESTVLCTSYSGDTEETLACYEAAGAVGARRVVASSGGELSGLARRDGVPVIPIAGGLQPRAALGYVFTAAIEVAGLAGVAPRRTPELDVAAAHLEELAREWGPTGPADSEPKALARALHGTIPLIYGAGPTRAVAYRWKCQFNENAKLHAFDHHLPELDHNELMGWERARESAPFSAVFLDDTDLHPRVKHRIEITRDVIAEQAAATVVVPSRSGSRVERLLSLVLLGDLTSIYLAPLRGADPSPIAGINTLKARLLEADAPVG
jgi:glucose/mannose-6-phosphate isomerase